MTTPRAADTTQPCVLAGDEDDADHWGNACDVRGLFKPVDHDGHREVELLGCAPQGRLQVCLGRIGGRRAAVGDGWLHLLDGEGVTMGSYFVNSVTVTGVEPSHLRPGLLDIKANLWCANAYPGADRFWNLICRGRLDHMGIWRTLDADGKRAWLSVAVESCLYQRHGEPDAPAGQSLTLDGRDILDVDSFYCAIGEAINGPGGYFGWNLDALVDCLHQGFGATPPFRLEWLASEVARQHLVAHHSVVGGQTLFDVLMDVLEEGGVEVILR